LSEGKVQVVVRSRKMPAETIELNLTRMSYPGTLVAKQRNRAILYRDVLDDEHRRAIQEGRRLADELGLRLEVVDESRSSFFRRVLSSLGRGSPSSPKLVITPVYAPVLAGATCGGSSGPR
jgi:hypothetical protein